MVCLQRVGMNTYTHDNMQMRGPNRLGNNNISCRTFLSRKCICHSHSRTPIIEMLVKYKGIDKAPFHIPGHKRGSGMPHYLSSIMSPETLASDLTELPGLDYLTDPSGVIAESQKLAAAAFGAERTWYLVNGTTVGLQAAILATCSPGDTLFVARNCHVSVFSGLINAGAVPHWIFPETDTSCGIAVSLSVAALEEALENSRKSGVKPKAVIVVSPTYYGTCSDVEGLARVCHNNDIPLIVDEAHGGHFGHQTGFPQSAMQQGADISVQSTHKTLTSMGQSSMLHMQGSLVDPLRISQAICLLQTTSPSYLLLASLDAAQAFVHDWRNDFSLAPLENVLQAREALRALPGIKLVDHQLTGGFESDPWRMTISTQGLGKTGFEVEELLQDKYDIFPELATQQVVVLAAGSGTRQIHLDMLVKAFSDISNELSLTGAICEDKSLSYPADVPQRKLSPRDAFFAEKELVSAQVACGRISGALLCPYPPGIPIAFPGEVIEETSIAYLKHVLDMGGKITGAYEGKLDKFSVIKESR